MNFKFDGMLCHYDLDFLGKLQVRLGFNWKKLFGHERFQKCCIFLKNQRVIQKPLFVRQHNRTFAENLLNIKILCWEPFGSSEELKNKNKKENKKQKQNNNKTIIKKKKKTRTENHCQWFSSDCLSWKYKNVV